VSERRYDPEIAPMVPMLPVEADWADLPAARAAMAQLTASLPQPENPPDERVAFEDRAIPGPSDAPELSVRVYTPPDDAALRPALLYIHGGGFCFGSVELEHLNARRAAFETGALVVSVEYRLAPEHPFPAGIEDCYAALSWLAGSADALGVDPARIAVKGTSAGGGLAAGLALLARDRGGPALCFQVLDIPELDHRLATPSMRECTDTPLWNLPNAIMSWRCYLGEDPGEVSPYASPALAKDLSGLPPAYVSTMEFDPLRDEGIDYALRLLRAGVPVELHQFPGTFHGSALVTGADVSRRANAEIMHVLGRALRPA